MILFCRNQRWRCPLFNAVAAQRLISIESAPTIFHQSNNPVTNPRRWSRFLARYAGDARFDTYVANNQQNCGDTLKKQKLDPHRNQCRGAQFTCLDCSTTFHGTDYRAHTSCVSEAQKYEKTVYKDKNNVKQNKRKSVSILEPTNSNALVPRRAYVEDEADVDHPPPVPTPPPAVRENPRDSVFDYMVEDDQPNTPKIAFSSAKDRESKEMAMKRGAPPLFNDSQGSSRNGTRSGEDQLHSDDFAQNGFSYGSEAINPRALQEMNGSYASLDFTTPAVKAARMKLEGKAVTTPGHSRTNSGSEKKRKRGQSAPDVEGDVQMGGTDTHLTVVDTPGIAHSGLTGGLQRLITDDSGFYPHSESDTDRRNDRGTERRKSRHTSGPASPLKRSRHATDKKNDSGLGISFKDRAAKALSMVGGAILPSQQQDLQNAKTRRRASSSDHYARPESREVLGEKRERKKHKVHRQNGTSSDNTRSHSKTHRHNSTDSPDRRKVKAIEYNKHNDDSASDSDHARHGSNGDMVVFGAEDKQKLECETFLSNIPRIGESEKGYSVHKALKRWHKQGDHRGGDRDSREEDLWRGLRLRKNERGEVVVFWGGLASGD